jgi:hypothetical protein
MAISSERRFYVASHTTREIKDRLEEEAHRRGMSVSLLMHRILVQAFSLREKKPDETSPREPSK